MAQLGCRAGAGSGAIGRPLGHHDDKLLIGAEDAVLLQELYYMGPEIVRRVNEFLQEDFFTAVKVSLMLDHQDLDAPSPVLERSRRASEGRGPRAFRGQSGAHGSRIGRGPLLCPLPGHGAARSPQMTGWSRREAGLTKLFLRC